jgi:hypothetical protein
VVAVQPQPPTLPPGLLDRLRSALVATRPVRFAARETPPGLPANAEEPPGVPAAAEEPPDVPAGPAAAPPKDAPRAVIFVSVLGLSSAALAEVLEAVIREGRGSPVRPVFLTDSLDFEPFGRQGLRFEYLPDGGHRQQFAPDLDWRAYERRRYRLLVEKWRPQSLIWFGTPPPPDWAAAIEPPV